MGRNAQQSLEKTRPTENIRTPEGGLLCLLFTKRGPRERRSRQMERSGKARREVKAQHASGKKKTPGSVVLARKKGTIMRKRGNVHTGVLGGKGPKMREGTRKRSECNKKRVRAKIKKEIPTSQVLPFLGKKYGRKSRRYLFAEESVGLTGGKVEGGKRLDS